MNIKLEDGLTNSEKQILNKLDPPEQKNMLQVLRNLGEGYRIVIIDSGICLLYDLQNGYDIEIEGGCDEKQEFSIYLWENQTRLLEIRHAKGISDLKFELDQLCEKYRFHIIQ
ncbi:hypothetical protein [Neobacillus mesonae]|uniref:hypothetical protein n=1 Tax=Neobacillus mesonae TaxID=1193713 RepID=UPI00203A8493|nr:hypothetical protein [Neobacillus mesonae]MCM3567548.1 hypothetical protein [Neobacillus mesonae]